MFGCTDSFTYIHVDFVPLITGAFLTVTLHVLIEFFVFAMIVVIPGLIALTTPFDDTVATALFLDIHVVFSDVLTFNLYDSFVQSFSVVLFIVGDA